MSIFPACVDENSYKTDIASIERNGQKIAG
jgi:hypothetical protein